ncbi:MAG: DUF6161 domain-containing protein [Roseibium sp.]
MPFDYAKQTKFWVEEFRDWPKQETMEGEVGTGPEIVVELMSNLPESSIVTRPEWREFVTQVESDRYFAKAEWFYELNHIREVLARYQDHFEFRGDQPIAMMDIASFNFAALFFEATGRLVTQFPETDSALKMDGAARFSALYAATHTVMNAAYDPSLEKLSEKRREILEEMDRDVGTRIKSSDQILQNSADKRESELLQNIESKGKEVLADLEENGAKHIAKAKDEFKASFVLETAMTLWKIKAAQHTGYFRLGAGVFALAIIVPVVSLFANWDTIVPEFQKIVPAGAPYAFANLLIITIPTLGYAWILRLISRFTLQNMVLADDASQRRVLASTYLRLIGQGKANDARDRAIMLNALFRPLPGSGEPDIQPPNLTDFVKGKT